MVKIALLGFGTIGSSLARIISEDGMRRREQLKQNPNSKSSISDALAQVKIVAIDTLEVEDVKKKLQEPEYAGIKDALVTDSFDETLATNPDIVVELIGGVEPAKSFISKALSRRIHIVTANKAVLGVAGEELRNLAVTNNVELLYEAAVGGAVPIVRAIRHSLMGDKILSIEGVLNGTTNFILDKMTSEGMDYSDALRQAQELGFAEADPTSDVEGLDPAAKISILASLAFGRDLSMNDVKTEGITAITQGMIISAKSDHLVYKLVAKAVRHGCSDGNDNIELSVAPMLVPEKSAFGELTGSMNAVEVVSEYSTKLTFFGPGAGGDPTASAVLADIIEIVSKRFVD
ncbi:MAG: homoserine dehydrogenase [Candidatus Ancillula sp.]|jgi:homoserine dehydrogenase|nr:homoserine dehydrogenase [Candidatus Ancillula sp.]